jgi:hypothetical protein
MISVGIRPVALNGRQIQKGTFGIAVASALLLGACHKPSSQEFGSLVGVKKMPSGEALNHETILINLRYSPTTPRMLTYELRPDNTITITQSLSEPGGDKDISKEVLTLVPAKTARMRAYLWRLRPSKLADLSAITYPTDCHPPIDASSELTVAFVDPERNVGVFALPYICKNGASAEARKVARAAIAVIPRTKTAEAFSANSYLRHPGG